MHDPAQMRDNWSLDPDVTFLNHGSFGACPKAVLQAQTDLRRRMEEEPVRFFARELEGLMDAARRELGAFLGAVPEDLVFVPNATTGVNAVLRSLSFKPGDELLTTDHAYNACANVLRFVAERDGAKVVVARIPFPIESPEAVAHAIFESVTPHTRFALLDHITSPTGLIFPIEALVKELDRRGVDVMVDGAHAPGMLNLRVAEVGAPFYSGNCHKWVCAPKGAGFLHVRPDRQHEIRPVTISHGANSPREDRSRYHLEFDWTGTDDPSPYLCIPEAIRFMGSLYPGGWSELMERNRALALSSRKILCDALGIPEPAPDEMIGTLASMPLPDGSPEPPKSPLYTDPLQDELWDRWRIEIPVIPWPLPPKRLLRISAQAYNVPSDYEKLAAALEELFPSG
jgi:isopenicillin-N epimerase